MDSSTHVANAPSTDARLTVAYVSVPRRDVSDSMIEDIVLRACKNNLANRITGVLLFNGLNFFQILQGDPAAVEAVFERISCDPRHHNVTRISAQPFAGYQFPAWGMALWGSKGCSQAAEYQVAETIGRSILDETEGHIGSMLRSFLGVFPCPTMSSLARFSAWA